MVAIDYKNIINHYYPEASQLRDILLVHSRGVADYALKCVRNHPEILLDDASFAPHCGAKAERLQFIETAAMLHDVGIVRCDAAGIQCFGTEPYICHGRLGAAMLRDYAADNGIEAKEMEPFARVCERHTGAGLTAEDIRSQNLPLPTADFLPETMVEKLICYADKFFSKTHPEVQKTYEQAERSLAKFGEEGLLRFRQWHRVFD